MADKDSTGKYAVTTSEGEYQPNSDEQVLKNKLDITETEEIDEAEASLLLKLYEHVFEQGTPPKELNFQLISTWHRMWLKPLYDWAGQLRSVNMSKGDFQFAAAGFLSTQTQEFENLYLSQYKTLANLDDGELVNFLAKSHVEFILIHPFREGNGRISRLLMDTFATQAGLTTLDYSLWDKHKDYYFKAIQAGVVGELEYMERLVRDILEQA